MMRTLGALGVAASVLTAQPLAHSGHDAVIERDNQLAFNGQIKRVYTFTLDGLTPEDIGTPVSATSIGGRPSASAC